MSLLNGFPIGSFLDKDSSGFFTFDSDLGSFFLFGFSSLEDDVSRSGLSSPGLMVFLLGNFCCWLIGVVASFGFFVVLEGLMSNLVGVTFRFLEASSDWNAKDARVVSDLKIKKIKRYFPLKKSSCKIFRKFQMGKKIGPKINFPLFD